MTTPTLHSLLFWLLAAVTGGAALGTALTRHPPRAVVCLLVTLTGVGGLFLLAGVVGAGVAQLIGSCGGMIFAGLRAPRGAVTGMDPAPVVTTDPIQWAFAVLLSLSLFAAIAAATVVTAWPAGGDPEWYGRTAAVGEALVGIESAGPPAPLALPGGAFPRSRQKIGYALPTVLVCFHLLVTLVAAGHLLRSSRGDRPATGPGEGGRA